LDAGGRPLLGVAGVDEQVEPELVDRAREELEVERFHHGL
jgi:hypothetical protein